MNPQPRNPQPRHHEHELVQAARALAPELREHTRAIEAANRLPAEWANKLAESGFFRMLVPASLGGGEVHPGVLACVLEELARGDSAASWCVMVGSTAGPMLAYLQADEASALFADDQAILAAVFAPMGRAVPDGDGYRVSGRWPFASGCQNATWFMGNALIFDDGLDGRPRMAEDGSPLLTSMWIPTAEAHIHDTTWSVSGLRGTGSHDIEVRDAWVPAARTTRIFRDRPRQDGPLYTFPLTGIFALGIAGAALGTARAALDAFAAQCQRKRPGRRAAAQQGHVQLAYAHAEAELRAGRAFLLQAIDEVWAKALAKSVNEGDRALLRMAASHAVKASVRAVDTAYHLGGGSAIYDRNPLSRHFRDIHTMTQHQMVAPGADKLVGRVLLGVETDTFQL